MSSSTWLRNTTAPGDTATFFPSSKAERSTCAGIPLLCRMSRSAFRAPCATLRPPVSNAALTAAGLPSSAFVGASADAMIAARKRARSFEVTSRLDRTMNESNALPHARYACMQRR
jgi:hypothetical protein